MLIFLFSGSNSITLTSNIADTLFILAKYCVGIFTLVGVSVLETMLVIFLMDLDGYCSKKTRDTEKSQVDIQLEANYHEGMLSTQM